MLTAYTSESVVMLQSSTSEKSTEISLFKSMESCKKNKTTRNRCSKRPRVISLQAMLYCVVSKNAELHSKDTQILANHKCVTLCTRKHFMANCWFVTLYTATGTLDLTAIWMRPRKSDERKREGGARTRWMDCCRVVVCLCPVWLLAADRAGAISSWGCSL